MNKFINSSKFGDELLFISNLALLAAQLAAQLAGPLAQGAGMSSAQAKSATWAIFENVVCFSESLSLCAGARALFALPADSSALCALPAGSAAAARTWPPAPCPVARPSRQPSK